MEAAGRTVAGAICSARAPLIRGGGRFEPQRIPFAATGTRSAAPLALAGAGRPVETDPSDLLPKGQIVEARASQEEAIETLLADVTWMTGAMQAVGADGMGSLPGARFCGEAERRA